MAILFLVSIECGSSKAPADAVADFLRGRAQLPSGRTAEYGGHCLQDDEGEWWVTVGADGISTSGGRNEREVHDLVELAVCWYGRMRELACPDFRYGQAGLEVDRFATRRELAQAGFFDSSRSGLILREDLWHEAMCPEGFETFKPGFVWRPYGGEYVRDQGAWRLIPPAQERTP